MGRLEPGGESVGQVRTSWLWEVRNETNYVGHLAFWSHSCCWYG